MRKGVVNEYRIKRIVWKRHFRGIHDLKMDVALFCLFIQSTVIQINTINTMGDSRCGDGKTCCSTRNLKNIFVFNIRSKYSYQLIRFFHYSTPSNSE